MAHPMHTRGRACPSSCKWTTNWACPASPIPGRRGYARDDGTVTFRCCCPLPPHSAGLLPPPPQPPPNVWLHAFFSCDGGTAEGSHVRLAPYSAKDTWVVLKSRDPGEPAPRLCEAGLRENGTTRLTKSYARQIWNSLPGVPRWSAFEDVGMGTHASAKLHSTERCKKSSRRPCASVLFVARGANSSGPVRRAYLGKFRRRERDDIRLWLRVANAESPGSGKSGPSDTKRTSCPLEIARRTAPPRLYTLQGLRTALSTAVCSRACSAARLHVQTTNATEKRARRAPQPSACLLDGGCVYNPRFSIPAPRPHTFPTSSSATLAEARLPHATIQVRCEAWKRARGGVALECRCAPPARPALLLHCVREERQRSGACLRLFGATSPSAAPRPARAAHPPLASGPSSF